MTHRPDLPLPPVVSFGLANEYRVTYDHIGSLFPPASQLGYNAWRKARLDQIIRLVATYSAQDAKIIVNDLMPYMTVATWFER